MYNLVTWKPGTTLEDHTLEVIEACFLLHKKNKKHTAEALGISKRNLDAKVKKIEKLRGRQAEEYLQNRIGDDFETQNLKKNPNA